MCECVVQCITEFLENLSNLNLNLYLVGCLIGAQFHLDDTHADGSKQTIQLHRKTFEIKLRHGFSFVHISRIEFHNHNGALFSILLRRPFNTLGRSRLGGDCG